MKKIFFIFVSIIAVWTLICPWVFKYGLSLLENEQAELASKIKSELNIVLPEKGTLADFYSNEIAPGFLIYTTELEEMRGVIEGKNANSPMQVMLFLVPRKESLSYNLIMQEYSRLYDFNVININGWKNLKVVERKLEVSQSEKSSFALHEVCFKNPELGDAFYSEFQVNSQRVLLLSYGGKLNREYIESYLEELMKING